MIYGIPVADIIIFQIAVIFVLISIFGIINQKCCNSCPLKEKCRRSNKNSQNSFKRTLK